jgi:hypothetical protein
VDNDVEDGTIATEERFFQPSHALTNIRDRLRFAYKGMASIVVSVPSKDRVTVSILALPVGT